MLSTLWKDLYSSLESSFHWMRVIISATRTRSMISGEARRESSQTLKMLRLVSMVKFYKLVKGFLRDGLVAAHKNLGVVLIKGTLVVTNSGHVLDDDGMVGVLAGAVEHAVGLNHVIDNVGLGDLLGAELLLRRQVLA